MHSRHGGDVILRRHGHGAEQGKGFFELGFGFLQQGQPGVVFELGRLNGVGVEGKRVRSLRIG